MKKYLYLFLLMLIANFCYSDIVRDIQDNHMVVYYIADTSGDHVGSQTVNLSIMKVSNEQWYDFNDSAFKASGWTSKTTSLSEDATNGFYYHEYDPPSSETTTDQYLFVIDNADGTYGDHQGELVSYQNIGTGTGTSTLTADQVWDEDITGHTTADTAGKRIGGLSEVGRMFGDGYIVDGATSTTIIDASFNSYGNDFFIGYYIIMTSGLAQNEISEVIDFVGSSGTFTVYPDWVTTPSVSDTYELWRGKPTIILPGR